MKFRSTKSAIAQFRSSKRGNVAIIFAFSLMPAFLMLGAAVDYSAASSNRSLIQIAADTSALAAVTAKADARNAMVQSIATRTIGNGNVTNAVFSVTGTVDEVTVTGHAESPTSTLAIANISKVAVGATATAKVKIRDLACILAFGKNMATSANAIDFNGSPSVALTGCGIMSNASLDCSGHTTGTPYASAVGTVTGSCPNPTAGVPPVPDIYAGLASNIELKCGQISVPSGLAVGTSLPTAGMIPVVRSGYLEYHVCGDLTLSGTGQINQLALMQDVVLVVENGSVILTTNADVSTARMTIVLSGAKASSSHKIEFPNGNGHSAKLTVSPSTNPSNPWHGISVYQDPSISTNVDMVWGPAASFDADGIVYFGNASLTMNGNASSSESQCTKIVVNQLTSNGNIDFKYSQTTTACSNLAVTQYVSPPVLTR